MANWTRVRGFAWCQARMALSLQIVPTGLPQEYQILIRAGPGRCSLASQLPSAASKAHRRGFGRTRADS